MIISAWIVLFLNILISLGTFDGVFTGKTTSNRVANFICCVGSVLACMLSIYILRL